MPINRKDLKRTAREAMRQAKPAPYLVSLVFLAVVMLLGVLGMSLDGTLGAMRAMMEQAMAGGPVQYVAPVARGGFFGPVLTFALELMSAVVSVGFILYSVRVWRRMKASVGNLLDGFGFFLRAVVIQILPTILVSMWGMVYMVPVTGLIIMTNQTWWTFAGLPLMIPAIRAIYAYRLSAYIMLDRPDLGCWQCVLASKRMMQGHKWEMFKLELSFLGWALLSAVIPIGGIFLLVWVSVYQQVTFAGYYDAVAEIRPAEDIPPAPPV